MTTRQNQHYVPKVYLKRFSVSGSGDLFSITVKPDYGRGRVKKVHSSQVCYEPNRYTVSDLTHFDEVGVDDPNFIEKTAFPYETRDLAEIFDILDNQERLFTSKAETLLKIVLSIKRRNPSFSKDFNTESVKSPFEQVINSVKDELEGVAAEHEYIRKAMELAIKGLSRDVRNESYVKDIYKRVLYDVSRDRYTEEGERIDRFMKLRFHIFYTEYSCPFITSDNPGYTIRDGKTFYNTNFSYAQQIVFPLSPRSIFMIDARIPDNENLIFKRIRFRKLIPSEVGFYNLGTVLGCNSKILGLTEESLEVARNLAISNAA